MGEETPIPTAEIRKTLSAQPLAGLGLFALFAFCLLFGIRYGDRVIWKLGIEPRIWDPLPVLMYHSVIPDGESANDAMTVTEGKLRQDFDYILETGNIPVLSRDLLDPVSLPKKRVLITFDDGYENNYTLLYPILQEYGFKALICPIVGKIDSSDPGFCTWDQLREMAASGLVEIGSHTYDLHHEDPQPPNNPKKWADGIQRRPKETDGEFQTRVLDDLQKSYDRLTEELGVSPVCFAYPYGKAEKDAQALIDALFPVSLMTWEDTADLAKGTRRLPRCTVTMDSPLFWYVK